MKRRHFLAAILGASVAPAIVRAASLMPVRVLDSGVLVPEVAPLWTATDGATLYGQEFTSAGTFTAPVGVTSVWLTVIGGGGGGKGDVYNRPLLVPNDRTIMVGKSPAYTLIQWIK